MPSELYCGVHEGLTAPEATHKLSFQQSILRTAGLRPVGLLVRFDMLVAVG